MVDSASLISFKGGGGGVDVSRFLKVSLCYPGWDFMGPVQAPPRKLDWTGMKGQSTSGQTLFFCLSIFFSLIPVKGITSTSYLSAHFKNTTLG